MARDGSGNYSRVVTPPVNGDIADATDYNAEIDDIATALSDSINRSGTKAFAADQSMGGFKLTNLAAPSSANDAARKTYVDTAISALSATYQPLDATVTALAALSWVSGSPLVQFTAADTVSLTLTPSVTSVTVGSGAAATPSVAVGQTNTGLYLSSANVLTVTAGGSVIGSFSTAGGFDILYQYRGPTGAAATPTYAHRTDTNTGLVLDGADGLSLATGGTNRFTLSTTLASFTTPVQARVALSTETTGTLTSASANRKVVCTGGITLDDGVFTADDFILFDPGTAARTFTRAAGLTMYVNGVDSASATLAANQMGAAHWRSAAVVVLTGAYT